PCPLTLSHSALLRLLDAEQPRSVLGESETNISDALVLGLHRLEASGDRRKVMVLLSDGEHNVPHPASTWTPRQAAQIAANLGIPVYTIDAGGVGAISTEQAREGTPASAGNRAEGIRTLQEVAQITSGRCFQAHDSRALFDVCRTIDRLERLPLVSCQYRRYYVAYLWLVLAPLTILATIHLL